MSRGLLVFLLFAACLKPHGPAVPALPSQGGPPWLEVTSPHFIVWTDSTEARARDLAQQMEDYRRILIGVLFAGTEPKAPPTLVFALRDAEEVGAYLPTQFVAFASPGGDLYQPAIVVPADLTDSEKHTFMHELTHAISYGVIPVQPKWFAEGLAGFFETIRTLPGGGMVEIGRPQDYIAQRLRNGQRTPSAAMFGCTQDACTDDMFYATTWETFAFLASTHPVQLGQYMDRLAAMRMHKRDLAAERALWDAVFPDLPPDRLDHAAVQWWAAGRGVLLKLPFKSEPVTLTTRPLRDADALAARGIMLWLQDRPEARAALDTALAADHTHLLARLAREDLAREISPDDARATAAAHPDDWRAWALVLDAVHSGPEAHEAHDKLCALVGNQPPASFSRDFCAR